MKKKGKLKNRVFPKWILAAGLVLILLCAYVLIEPYWLVTKEYDIYNPAIPKEFDGYEIVFVADIHHGPFFSYERAVKLKDRINEMGVDLILLGGDYVHRGPAYVAPAFDALNGLHANSGAYGVLGNHDHWDGEQATRDGFAAAGIVDIENRKVVITRGGSEIHIAGVGDFDMGRQEYSRELGIYSILVSHNP
ncbi:MAG: metallophosphoesterase, partial [Clostridia bacterium]|nr:metallophosphoesterase [Clostridia bacterium]